MTFSEEQQQRARDLFIEECRQNAWAPLATLTKHTTSFWRNTRS
jgi:hypothetical protein